MIYESALPSLKLWPWQLWPLQKRRWLVRRKSSVDQRRHGIFLTAAGRHGLEALRRDMLEHEQRFTRLFSPDEMTMLVTLLRRIHP